MSERTLADAVVGDVVIEFGRWRDMPRERTISRTTATEITAGDSRFMRRNGAEIGSSYYDSHIELATPSVREKAAERTADFLLRRRRNIASGKLRRLEVSNDNLERVEAFLSSLELK